MNRRVLFTVVVVGLLAVSGAVGPAAAGDGWSVIEFEPENSTAAPGETVEIELGLSGHGSYSGGLAEVDLQVDYNASYLTVTNVESAGWFEQGDEAVTVDSELEIDDEAGVVNYTEVREPAGDGTTGNAPFATLTIEVDDDAPPAETTLRAGDSTTHLAGGWPHPVSSRHATLTITEGGSTADANGESTVDTDDSADSNGESTVDTDDSADSNGESTVGTEDSADTNGESTVDTARSPVVGGVALLGALLAVHLFARRSE